MQAVILAAGQSSRFYPYNNPGHKSLVALCGKTLIARTLDSLRQAGILEVVIVEGMDEAVSKSLSFEDTKGLAITFIIQEKATGMGDALLCATKYLKKTFFVLNAYHFEVSLFVKEMIAAQKGLSDIVLLTTKTDNPSVFGTITQKKGTITVSEKKDPKSAEKIVGIYLLSREFAFLLNEEKKDHYSFENALTSYSKKHTLMLVKTERETLSLKYPWDLLTIKDYLFKDMKYKISKLAAVSKKATIIGDVYVSDDAVIMDGAVIYGPAYIGRRAYVGSGAILRSGVFIEENAVVGAHMEIKNSILMRGATTHSGFIGDSVIGEKTRIAAGFNTANVRLDKKEVAVIVKNEKINTHRKYFGAIIGSHVSIGIKVGIMPGVIVGNNTIIGPGTTVMENIEDNVTYYTEFKKTVKKQKV